jgi:hypothetical protein
VLGYGIFFDLPTSFVFVFRFLGRAGLAGIVVGTRSSQASPDPAIHTESGMELTAIREYCN